MEYPLWDKLSVWFDHTHRGLNPSSNGIPVLGIKRFSNLIFFGVLILLLMEYPLWGETTYISKRICKRVLILLLMEYPFWVQVDRTTKGSQRVS